MSFADEIKNVRKKAMISQEDFAFYLGIAFSTVNRWENGRAVPNYKAMQRIVSFCQQRRISTDELNRLWQEEKGKERKTKPEGKAASPKKDTSDIAEKKQYPKKEAVYSNEPSDAPNPSYMYSFLFNSRMVAEPGTVYNAQSNDAAKARARLQSAGTQGVPTAPPNDIMSIEFRATGDAQTIHRLEHYLRRLKYTAREPENEFDFKILKRER